MTDFFNKYPYTDFHELNLDWVIERVKKLTEDWAATLTEWNNTEEEWQQLYDYVHDYFDNLDVQQEINTKIDQMILNGTFATIATPIIENQVIITTTAWLADHITQPTTPAIDTSLSIAGAAADSKTVGDRFTDLELNALTSYQIINSGNYSTYLPTKNLSDLPANSMSFLANDTVWNDAPSGQHKYYVTTCMIDPDNNYGITQKCYDADDEKEYIRWSLDGVTYSSWELSISPAFLNTYGSIDSGNYSTLLPTKNLSDLPANSIAYLSNNTVWNDAPSGQHAYMVWTYAGFNNLLYAKFQRCYDITEKREYTRYSNNGVTFSNWLIATDASIFRTYGQINSSNYSTLLPSKNISDLPANCIAYMSNDTAWNDAPEGQDAYLVMTYAGFNNLTYAKFQRCYDISTGKDYVRYANDGVTFSDWDSSNMSYKEACSDYYVNTCVDKPITMDNTTGLFIFGDSIATNYHGGISWGSIIATKTGCTEYNYAVNSACFNTNVSNNIMAQINSVSDWTNADIVIVAAGTNENLGGPIIGSDLRTYVQDVIDEIKTNAPSAKIIFITPIKRKNWNVLMLAQISGAICNVALENNCSVICGADIPIALTYDSNDFVQPLDSGDNLHPDADGKLAYAMAVLNAIL